MPDSGGPNESQTPPAQGGEPPSHGWLTGRADPSPTSPSEGAPLLGGEENALWAGQNTHPKSIPLEEIFRFDLTIRAVLARWPRVSTSLADLQLQGYRVPLVTGPAETDLAGALTYYFNSYQQLQRITFQGTTGEGRQLVEFLASRYGFQRRLTNDPSLFVYEVPRLGGPPQSILRLKLAPTLKADMPHQRFDVWLVIERPEEPPKPFWQRTDR